MRHIMFICISPSSVFVKRPSHMMEIRAQLLQASRTLRYALLSSWSSGNRPERPTDPTSLEFQTQLGKLHYSLPSVLAALTCSKTCCLRLAAIPPHGILKRKYLQHLVSRAQSINATSFQALVVQLNQLLPLQVLQIIRVFVQS
jgi:hypothetical protein